LIKLLFDYAIIFKRKRLHFEGASYKNYTFYKKLT
jgi:hypothetical protein